MKLTRKLGRHVERFKQSATDASDSGSEYECLACGSEFVREYETCPDCGADDVAPVADD